MWVRLSGVILRSGAPAREEFQEDSLMRRKDGYRDFQDQIFQEIGDLESERNKYILTANAREYGLTLNEAARLYYKPGMTGQQFLDAMKAQKAK
jgi:hypothetical protein